ncbi:hypothetical protein AAHZ94_00125 [Streptomyces sp. HSW2009]|uniref:hypothetical protein n=1 Tax=Streptomyces sp. HSW2009 TaxID=3142890 RepID=UPI0032ECBA44
MVAKRQEEASPDAVLTRIGQAVMLHRGGDREEARNRLAALWQEVGPDGDSLHHCTLAHYLADTQDDPADELAWDLRALAAADKLTRGPDGPADTRAGQAPTTGSTGPTTSRPGDAGEPGADGRQGAAAVRGFYPSLHLNLAADYLKLGRLDAARAQLDLATAASGALGDDSYGEGVRVAIGRMALRLSGAVSEHAAPPRQRPWS